MAARRDSVGNSPSKMSTLPIPSRAEVTVLRNLGLAAVDARPTHRTGRPPSGSRQIDDRLSSPAVLRPQLRSPGRFRAQCPRLSAVVTSYANTSQSAPRRPFVRRDDRGGSIAYGRPGSQSGRRSRMRPVKPTLTFSSPASQRATHDRGRAAASSFPGGQRQRVAIFGLS